jgi:hypothetical protein
MMTTKQYQAEKRKLLGGVDPDRAFINGFRFEIGKYVNTITWRKKGVSLTFVYTDARHLSYKRLQNMWAIAYLGLPLMVESYSEGLVETKDGLRFELDHPFRCDRHPTGMNLSVWLQNEVEQEWKKFYWKTRDGEYIKYEEIANHHLANIIGKVPHIIPDQIKNETKKRFGNVLINETVAASAGCCQKGVEAFKRKYRLGSEVTLSFLIDHIDFSPKEIGKVIKMAIQEALVDAHYYSS